MTGKKILREWGPTFLRNTWKGGDRRTLRCLGGEEFDLSLVWGIPRRCSFGVPQVVACAPLRRGKPFPTNWWLVCPFLREQCAREEELGGVQELETFLLPRGEAWRAYARRHALWRLAQLPRGTKAFLFRHRPGFWKALVSTGPGGICSIETPRVKCLHLQMASWLIWRDHPGGPWLAQHFPQLQCPSPGRCRVERDANDERRTQREVRCP